MNRHVTIKEPFLFLAGSWFATAFSVPVLLLWTQSEKTAADFLFFFFPAVCIAFLCGEAFGSDILNSDLVQSSRDAVVKGAKILLLTYGYLTPVIALSYAVYQCMFFRNEHEWLTVQFVEYLFLGLFQVGIVGTIVFGWLLALLGAFAGWTLFKFRIIQERP